MKELRPPPPTPPPESDSSSSEEEEESEEEDEEDGKPLPVRENIPLTEEHVEYWAAGKGEGSTQQAVYLSCYIHHGVVLYQCSRFLTPLLLLMSLAVVTFTV